MHKHLAQVNEMCIIRKWADDANNTPAPTTTEFIWQDLLVIVPTSYIKLTLTSTLPKSRHSFRNAGKTTDMIGPLCPSGISGPTKCYRCHGLWLELFETYCANMQGWEWLPEQAE